MYPCLLNRLAISITGWFGKSKSIFVGSKKTSQSNLPLSLVAKSLRLSMRARVPSKSKEKVYREYCSTYQKTSRCAKSEFYEQKLKKYASNVKETWKILRAAIGYNKKGGANFPNYFFETISPKVATQSGGGPGVGGDGGSASASSPSAPPPEPSAPYKIKVTDKQLIAEGFNEYFSTIGVNLATKIESSAESDFDHKTNVKLSDGVFKFQEVDTETIL